nr:hypothetical protein [Haloferax larsenii]
MAETLGISKSTVGEYVRRVENRVEESIRTLEEVSNEIHPLRHMEGQLNGWPVFIGDEYPCGGCGSIIEAGSEAVAVLEFVGQNWQTHEMYCKECDRDDYHIAAPVGHSMSIDEFFDEFQEAGSLVALVEADIGSLDARFASLRTPYKAGSLTLEDPYVRDVFN